MMIMNEHRLLHAENRITSIFPISFSIGKKAKTDNLVAHNWKSVRPNLVSSNSISGQKRFSLSSIILLLLPKLTHWMADFVKYAHEIVTSPRRSLEKLIDFDLLLTEISLCLFALRITTCLIVSYRRDRSDNECTVHLTYFSRSQCAAIERSSEWIRIFCRRCCI